MAGNERVEIAPTIKIVVYTLDGEEYGSPVEEIKEVIKEMEVTPVPNSPEFMPGFINLRGDVIPVLDLEKKFGLERESKTTVKKIIVVDAGEDTFGVFVDDVLEVLDIDKEKIQDAPKAVKQKIDTEYIKGVIIIEDEETEEVTSLVEENADRALLLLDLRNLLSEDHKAVVANAGKEKSNES